jgi:HEPN domain-containing protein
MAGLLFVIHPLVLEHGASGFSFFGNILQFVVLYYTLIALLGGSVYCFAIDYISETPVGRAHDVGNFFYAMALLFPPVFAVLWLSVKMAEGIVWLSDSTMAGEVSKAIFMAIAAISGGLIALIISRRMNSRDRSDNVNRLAVQSGMHLDRAVELAISGHNDLATLEAFRSVEAALQRALIDSNVRVKSSSAKVLIPTAAREGIVKEEQVGVLHELRVARNRAVHNNTPIPDEDAAWFIETTRRVLQAIHVRRVVKPPEEPAPGAAG